MPALDVIPVKAGSFVIPTKVGIQQYLYWTPAFAGVTDQAPGMTAAG